MIEYKGYIADIEYDDSVNMLYGRVANSGPYSIADCLASDIEGLKREFAISIDIYLASCMEDGVEPVPPEPLGEFLSERLHLRLNETLLGRVAQAARDSDQSLDCWVAQALERSLAAETPAPSRSEPERVCVLRHPPVTLLRMSNTEHIKQFMRSIRKTYRSGKATEASHYPALKVLLESLEGNIEAILQPTQSDFGIPDIVVQLDNVPIGHIECKDLHVSLDDVEFSPQLMRYRNKCDNLILTNFGEFRWYRKSQLIGKPVVIAILKDRKIQSFSKRYVDLFELLVRFRYSTPSEITSPQELVTVMATMTREIAERINNVLESSNENSFILKHKRVLEIELLPKLKPVEFADMYAQTLAFALFTARVHHEGPAEEFTLPKAFFNMPTANPFLRREFRTIVSELDDSVQEAVELLAKHFALTRIDEILQGFGRWTERRDPVIHFYEDFLAAYDNEERERRGVYFTPEPIVSFIVRSVDTLLQTKLGRSTGLADNFVKILDPATGTGSFLLAVVQKIYNRKRGQLGSWPSYVQEKLLPRLFGFELLMAPYTLAHMRLAIFLEEFSDYRLEESDRLRIYLTNSLHEPQIMSDSLSKNLDPYLVDEAKDATAIKQKKEIMVVLGNPPYSGHSANKKIPSIQDKLREYFWVDGVQLNERNPKWLNDDYVKFIRFGQDLIEGNEEGILAYITNHAWLDNPTFPGMRQSLLKTFNEIYVLDLHGNIWRKEEENVFEIMQGVAIAVFVKKKGVDRRGTVHRLDIRGKRQAKYDFLNANDVGSIEWQEVDPQSPFYFFKSFDYEGWHKYDKQGWNISKALSVSSPGVVTGNNAAFIDFDSNVLRQRMSRRYKETIQDSELEQLIQTYLYHPFDDRFLFHSKKIERPRMKVMRHMTVDKANLGLICVRQVAEDEFNHVFVSQNVTDFRVTISNRGGATLFPLYSFGEFPSKTHNFSHEFVSDLEAKLNLHFNQETIDEHDSFSPEDVFHYIYAILNSPKFRQRYSEFLRIDFPRVPLTTCVPLFRRLGELGGELVDWHLLQHVDLQTESDLHVNFLIRGNDRVEKGFPKYDMARQRVYINKKQYFGGVPQNRWELMIGGYQVLKKWLSDRRGRTLGDDDVWHYRKTVRALGETRRLMREIDAAIGDFPLP